MFPLWQVDRREYDAVCAYLGITPRDHIYDALATHLAEAPFRVAAPEGLFGRLAGRRLTPWTIARLDLATRLFAPGHPIRHVLNGTIALHEVDGDGYPELAAAPTGWRAYASMLKWGLGLVLNLALTLPWLAWQGVLHLLRAPFGAVRNNLRGERVLITGVGRGLGRDLMLHCLERGADVVGVVRDRASFERLRSELPARAPLTLVVADLATPGALTEALEAAKLARDTFSIVIASAGVKHDGRSVDVAGERPRHASGQRSRAGGTRRVARLTARTPTVALTARARKRRPSYWFRAWAAGTECTTPAATMRRRRR